mmetsp:Transcript_14981/g.24380  ORF Transcript_14981/g.24380 Transcript_14981/m.24380 type:complete len:342 (+) Transcript_14981:66-1091(+)
MRRNMSGVVRRSKRTGEDDDEEATLLDIKPSAGGFASLEMESGSQERHSKNKLVRGIKLVVLILLGILVLDWLYLAYKKWTFVDPCELDRNAVASFSEATHLKFPKIIHQQWKTDQVPEGEFLEYHNAWKSLYPEPEYTHMLWTDKTMRELIENDFPWFLEAYDGYVMNIQRADSVRYFILYKYGGIYADLDYEPFRNFWEHFPKDRPSLIESPYKINEMVQNSLMASPVGHPFWNTSFNVLFERRRSKSVLSSTGPAMMDETIRRSSPSDYYILPCENFHRIPLGAAGKGAPAISILARYIMAYSPAVKTCGDWAQKDNCQYGLHHNAVSYFFEMGKGSF